MIKRRSFVKSSVCAGGAVALGILPRSLAAQTHYVAGATKSRVVRAHSPNLQSNLSIHQTVLSKLLDLTMESLFQVSVESAWKSLFSPSDVVGLKVNCLAGKNLSTHKELVDEIIERLLRVGVKKSNIFIFDRRNRDLQRAGYTICLERGKVQCLGNDVAGFSEQIFEYGSVGSQISNTLYKQCTAVINLPILKDHGIVGISGGLKNFFGVINNPNKYHMNVGDPFVADVNMLPPIREKHRLTICDAITAQYNGGPPFMPEWSWPMNSLIAATDMVAMDQLCWTILEEERAKHGFESLEKANRKPTYIATAADENHRLGTNNPDNIEVVRV